MNIAVLLYFLKKFKNIIKNLKKVLYFQKKYDIIIAVVGVFPSGQREQTVNLLRFASAVQIRPLP